MFNRTASACFVGSLCAFLLSTFSSSANVLVIDFNDLQDPVPAVLAGQGGNENLLPWESDDLALKVVAGDLTAPAMSLAPQSGTPQSASGDSPAPATARLVSRWNTDQFGKTFWFAFLFHQPSENTRVGLNLNGARIIAVGSSLLVTSATGSPVRDLALAETHLVVGRLDIDTADSAEDTIQLWVDPTDITGLDKASDEATTFLINAFFNGGIISVGIESYSEYEGESGGIIDNIIVATSLKELTSALLPK